ncbi:MAG: GGDEF domain-containing protein [Pseudomonas sp.]|nr:MAG: GGDEF domain-containing protein [Pseudomonas sp.]
MPRTLAQTRAAQRRTMWAATLFVVFVCLSLLSVDGWLAWRARDQDLQRAVTSNTNLASAVAQEMDGMVSEISHLLEGVALEIELGEMDQTSLDHLQLVLKKQAAVNRHLHGLFVYDVQGQWLISTPTSPLPNANNADRDYFVHHRRDPSLAVRVGEPIVSRSTGAWIIPVSRRLNDPSGQFAGVALATIDANHVGRLLSTFDIGQNGSLTWALGDGTILVRRPFAVENFGKKVAGTQLQEQLMAHVSGSFENVSPIDGVARLGSFQHIQNHRMLVSVALSKDELLHSWRQTTRWQTLWILLLCGVTALAGGHVVRSVRQRMKVELHLERTRDELTLANARLSQLASYDGLTGLANRRFFDEVLDRAVAESWRSGQPLSLVMIDVDHFKQYNDFYGHLQGDHCLQQVALAIQMAVRRPLDFVARYGGEEMVMLLPNTDGAGAYVVAETAREAVERLMIEHQRSAIGHVSISAGVATLTDEVTANHTEDMIGRADQALYNAKSEGRNRVFMNEPVVHPTLQPALAC